MIYDKLDQIVQTGANIILSRLPIGDLATQYFADRDIFCAGRVPQEDLTRLAKSTGGIIQTTLNGITAEVLGTCGEFEEVQLG
jgi:T-complex protein 1 subunit eta